MNQSNRRTLAATLVALAAASLPQLAAAQPAAAKASPPIAGTWTLQSNILTQADGKKAEAFGPNPRGLAIFNPDGHYAVVIARASLPKFASGSRLKGTPEENQAVVHGSVAVAGKYRVDAAAKTITFDNQTSTWPAWIGSSATRAYTLAGDQLRWTVDASAGGSAEVVWKRAR
jgi:hypothetical protein